MPSPYDFLGAIDIEFNGVSDFISYVEKDVDLDEITESIHFVGAISDYPTKDDFARSLSQEFEILNSTGDLYLLSADTGKTQVPYYAYADLDFPLFITTANITDEMPPTINAYLQKDLHVGRFWLSRREMEKLRRDIVSKYKRDIIIPFFSAKYSPHIDVSSKERPDVGRSMTYYGDDGLESYREMHHKYGVLPRILEFERANHFKFRVKNRGVFVHEKGSIMPLWNLLQQEIERKKRVKDVIGTSEYDHPKSAVFDDAKLSISRPWGINVKSGVKPESLSQFEAHLAEREWEFDISEYYYDKQANRFEAELIDSTCYERTRIKSRDNLIHVYPRELTDVDQSFRIYSFVDDHFGPKCEAVPIE